MLICILGRQPRLGIAELEAVLGPKSVQPLGSNCALIKIGPDGLPRHELGGTIKIADVISSAPSTPKWKEIASFSLNTIINHILGRGDQSEHKLTLGLSVYGMKVGPKQIEDLSFDIKKGLKKKGRSARVVISQDSALNSAQVIHNKLLGGFGFEFLLVVGPQEIYIAKTISVQDIDSYSKRDYNRPKRDTKVGMLPPKLAQIMLNLAGVGTQSTVLDPFCGTGVVLMEAALMGAKLVGSDLNRQMVEYTKENLEWLSKEYKLNLRMEELACADAISHKWRNHFDRVVSEVYLGPPLNYLPGSESLNKIVSNSNNMLNRFLVNLRLQLTPKSRCCIAVPAWRTPGGFVHLPILEKLEELGFARVKFEHAGFGQMVYHRPDQIVARELLVLTPA